MARAVSFAHSPDPDDAFMAWALATGRVADPAVAVSVAARDIATLNQEALAGAGPDVSALSAATFLRVAERYTLLRHGASFGEGYGPIVVARAGAPVDWKGLVAIPGPSTTAAVALALAKPGLRTVTRPFDAILDAVRDQEADLGLVIHEGQLTFAKEGLAKVLDLGAWWRDETGLPLPLGVVAAKRALGDALAPASRVLKASIEAGLAHRADALRHARSFGRGLDREETDRFVAMYVNARTLDMGDDGLEALRAFARRAAEAGLLPTGADRFSVEPRD
ncbi:MAG TPA: MqnA/MqnD/SBP family protein [Candidatus Thermoplasmatota archaeon]|nr:MqnA/MqnD/SBP family protein [Candidatus Thermoplasmatota archaeon]